VNFINFNHQKWISKQRTSLLLFSLFIILLLVIAIEQWLSYHDLQNSIGKYAYSKSYALRTLGKEHQYVGKVIDVEWNSLPRQEKDIEGFQPRLLVARETTAGVTETQWWCAYLLETKDQEPKNFKPSPFPKLRLLPGAR